MESISGGMLTVLPVYGGAPYEPQVMPPELLALVVLRRSLYMQERGLVNGVDVLVGTPGRIMVMCALVRCKLILVSFRII